MSEFDQLITDAHAGRWTRLRDAATQGQTWTSAPCREADPEIFFADGDDPARPDPSSLPSLDDAVDFCLRCPLPTRASCLLRALEDGDEYGVRGGLSALARKPLHEARRRRLNDDTVARALEGEPVELSDAERTKVIQLFVKRPELSATTVSRATGISRGLLAYKAYRERKRAHSLSNREHRSLSAPNGASGA